MLRDLAEVDKGVSLLYFQCDSFNCRTIFQFATLTTITLRPTTNNGILKY